MVKSTTTLNNGITIPTVGLGCYLVEPNDIETSIRSAIENGYRHIDTASYYKNEKEIGNVIKKLISEGKVKREDLFITTKLGTWQHGYENGIAAFEESLKNLQLDYLDLYLIHYPGTYSQIPKGETMSSWRAQSWKALEKLYQDKKVRAIGVSNYTVAHLQELLSQNPIVKPTLNQVEYHPYLNQEELLDFCKKNDIVLEAYGSLSGGNDVLEEPIVKSIANSLSKSPAQILLRWAIQKDIVVIPKSIKADRIKENISIFDFEISEQDMSKLNKLNKDKRFYWDPNTVA